MQVLLALKDAIESDARMEAKVKANWIDFLVTARKDFYNRWVKEDVHKALFVSFEQEAQQAVLEQVDELVEVARRALGELGQREGGLHEDRRHVEQRQASDER